MIRLSPGQTVAQKIKADPYPHIHNFVKQSQFIKPQTQRTSKSVINLGK